MNDKDTVVVPRVPTDEMLAAVPGVFLVGAGRTVDSDEVARDIWSAMLAAAPSTSVREEELAEALVGIHQARLHNGRDEGWGWDIGLLNRAMDVALPLIGQPRPERMSHEERTALRARFDALLDADRAALKPSTDKGGEE